MGDEYVVVSGGLLIRGGDAFGMQSMNKARKR
jgi:hypothetical protein